MEMMARPIFLETVPDRKPRTECGCQPVAFISSLAVTPPGRPSRSIILAALLLSRATPNSLARLDVFFASLALILDLPFLGATFARRAPTRAVLLAFGSAAVGVKALSAASVIEIIVFSPLSVITA